ncbi:MULTISPECIES: response regulator transcription factor [unclassified Rubrivivax]|uniref:response regulator transcription factor n=1 Tax=unclassified Rubrivivax TaxID=2649762 RepID=UPI0013E9481E|nr:MULTISPECIES: response regulator [unclassified Rubrivivax]MCC9597551.1 response regulator [Rubrivivax sp. JA1055]MCC9646191.1 response regulator [Rubrivivax sp. JA1029]MCD0416487.1 response regulator [Rubrivivax sp. JA1024]
MAYTILSIEDQPDIRRLIRMTLEFKGYEVVEAGDGEEGLALARRSPPDLILLDVMMPGMDGHEVARQLHADPRTNEVPVVMISALGQTSEIEAGLLSGALHYLVKPFSPWALLDITAQLVRRAPTQEQPA